MATIPELNTPTLGGPGDACAMCSAPLAPDQRYCLSCGARRGPARVALHRGSGATGGAPAVSETIVRSATPAPTARSARSRSSVPFLAGLACLLLALGVGVLIGRAGTDKTTVQPAAAPAPQVITVQGGGGTATTPPTPGDTGGGGGGTATPKAGAHRKTKPGGASTSKRPSRATNQALKNLDKGTPAQVKKKSDALPKQVGTGGKPPKVDKSKPAGGGSAVESIG